MLCAWCGACLVESSVSGATTALRTAFCCCPNSGDLLPIVLPLLILIARCVHAFSESVQGLIHADLKPLNAVRVKSIAGGGGAGDRADAQGEEGKWLLIDLDAASTIGKGFVGLKSSTAVRSMASRSSRGA